MKQKIPPGYAMKNGKLIKLAAQKDGKRYLSPAELLAVQLMNARAIMAQKNQVITQLQNDILKLQKELCEARGLVLQYQNQAESQENMKLAQEYGLPTTFDIKNDDGRHYIVPAAEAQAAPVKLLKPQVPVAPVAPIAPTNGHGEEAPSDEELAAMIAQAEAEADGEAIETEPV